MCDGWTWRIEAPRLTRLQCPPRPLNALSQTQTPSQHHSIPSSPVHTDAQDFSGDAPILRRGPTSLLPAHENQIVVWNYQTGVQHAMFVDTTAAPPRVINCSRVQEGTQTGAAMRASWAG